MANILEGVIANIVNDNGNIGIGFLRISPDTVGCSVVEVQEAISKSIPDNLGTLVWDNVMKTKKEIAQKLSGTLIKSYS